MTKGTEVCWLDKSEVKQNRTAAAQTDNGVFILLFQIRTGAQENRQRSAVSNARRLPASGLTNTFVRRECD